MSQVLFQVMEIQYEKKHRSNFPVNLAFKEGASNKNMY